MADYYSVLPTFDDLKPPQRSAVNDPNPIKISGAAGSGKSLVSLYRHARSDNSQLLTYTKTLAEYLTVCCRRIDMEAAGRITTINKWIWDYLHAPQREEIIIDEAQDLAYAYIKGSNLGWSPTDDLDSSLPKINIHTDYFSQRGCKISYGADNAQQLNKENGMSQEELKSIYPDNKPHPLGRSFRSTKKILSLARACFPDSNITSTYIDSCSREGELPIFIKTNDSLTEILKIIKSWHADTHNIGILFPWKKNVREYYNAIKNTYPEISYYVTDQERTVKLNNIHITTFKSAKGLEFDTVILPGFNMVFKYMNPIFRVSWKDFYVGVTRSKTNLYLLDSNELPKFVWPYTER